MDFSIAVGTLGLLVGLVGLLFGMKSSGQHRKSSAIQINKLDTLRDEKETLQRLYQELEEKEKRLQLKLPLERTHTVLLDGMSQAGKSTFAARLSNPAATTEELSELEATSREYVTGSLPLCWDRARDRTVLHTVRFYDVSGERGSTVINAIFKLFRETHGGFSAKKDPKITSREEFNPHVTLAVVWDVTANNGENREALNATRMESVFGNDLARKLIKSVVVFFNKTDCFERKILEKRIAEEKQYIRETLTYVLDDGLEDIIFSQGSALHGTGLFDCYGKILQSFDLRENFIAIKGN